MTSLISVIGGHQISVKRFLNAGDNSFLPKSPPGFMVAKYLNESLAIIKGSVSSSSLAFSANNNVLSYSSTEFNLSRTESSANDISSTKKYAPSFIAFINGPSTHSNSFCS